MINLRVVLIASLGLFNLDLLAVETELVEQQISPIDLTIQKVKFEKGDLQYQLFECSADDQVKWHDLTPVVTRRIKPKQESVNVKLDGDIDKAFCLRVFQDSNNNGQLDFGTAGIPKEAVGFSINPNLMLGQPVPADTRFHHRTDTKISIDLNYPRHRKRRN